MKELICGAVAKFLKLNSKIILDLDQYRMRAVKPLMPYPTGISLIKISADEVHIRTRAKKARPYTPWFWSLSPNLASNTPA